MLTAIAFLAVSFGATDASAQTRSLKIHFTHTKERAEITYKRNGRYVQSGLNQLNHILRDWRRNEPTKMDPRLFDLLWEVYQASGSRDYIHVVSAYRSPETNSMLRSRSSGVAKKSQHMLGKAMDFYLPDVSVKKIRQLGMKFQVGGVGYYPTSGVPFVHLDVGSVRAWPRMSRQELVALFPDGKTLHLPPDGRKLAGYEAALADYQRRVGASQIAVAGGGARDGSRGGERRNLLAMLFGNSGDEDENADAIASPQQVQPSRPAQAPQPAPQPQVQVAAAPAIPSSGPIPVNRPVIGSVPPPQLASLAPVGGSQTPPGVAAQQPPALAAAVPPEPETPAKPQYVDLASLNVPVPEFRADRSGVSVFAAEDAPELKGRDVTDILVAEAAAIDRDAQSAVQTALVPRPSERPEVAAIAAATSGGVLPADKDDAGPPSQAAAAPAPVEMASLEAGSQPSDDAGAIAERMRATVGTSPLKGARPTAADAARSDRQQTIVSEPKLTERIISRWAIRKGRMDTIDGPVKQPRFVSKDLRQAPAMVYTTGFSADTVEANRFTGAAVNFMTVARFEKSGN